MTNILLVTGSAGVGITQAASATALATAARGQRTLLLSLGPAHALGPLLSVALGSSPLAVAPQLDALAIDALSDLATLWEARRGRAGGSLAQIGGDELPLLPGTDILFGMVRLRELAAQYDQIVVDAGPHDALLRSLSLPDTLRWGVRLLLGLDRGPGRSSASVGRAMLPSFLAPDVAGQVQDLRVTAEQLRAQLLDPAQTAVRYVLRPDRAALDEARLAVPALQLHGLLVASLVGGPLLPGDLADARLRPLAQAQAALLDEARQIWPNRPLLPLELLDPDGGIAALRAAGAQLAPEPAALRAPLAERHEGAPALAVDLPGMPTSALRLTHSGDEMVIRVGPYRRHVLLPEALRGAAGIRASRAGDLLLIRAR